VRASFFVFRAAMYAVKEIFHTRQGEGARKLLGIP
jgi:hypothetical protein